MFRCKSRSVNKTICTSILYILFPLIVAVANTTHLKVKVNDKQIKYNDIVYIDNYPEFPKITAEVPLNCKAVEWKVKSIFNRPNRNKHRKPFEIKYNGNKYLLLSNLLKAKFIGGILIISAKTSKGESFIFSLNIRARNPSENAVIKYIGDHPKFAKAIAMHESGFQNGRYLCQFNEIGELGDNYLVNIKHTPNRGSDTLGWGIFQITNPSPSKTDLWNWKANIDTGKQILHRKEKTAEEYFKAVKRTFPKEYEPPPVKYKVPNTNTILTSLEAATIQLYNGGAVVKSLKNSFGTYSSYASSWSFLPDEPSGKRWKFIPNRNNYVQKVVLAYENLQNKKNS